MRPLTRVVTLLLCLLLPGFANAHSAIAWVEGHSVDTTYASWNYGTQKIADKEALAGCQKAARENGLAKLAPQCKVKHRQKGAGGGALVCGKSDCWMSTGYDTQQDAVDRAFLLCQQNAGECKDTEMISWLDEAGYPKKQAEVPRQVKACGPPPGRVVRSKTQCHNSDCTRTFENGCTVNFQAPYCHDPVSGKWEFKPDGC